MTVVQFDEPDARVDTDASGEPCIVMSGGNTLTAVKANELAPALVASQLAAAYAMDPRCLICSFAIASVRDAAFLSTRNRVVHTEPCLAQFLVNTYQRRSCEHPSYPWSESLPGQAPESIDVAWNEAIDEDLDRAIDRFCRQEYATLKAPVLLVGSQKCTFRHRLLNAIDTAPEHVVIDMSDTRYVDSSGLSMLLSARHRFRQAMLAGHIVLVGINPDIRALLELTRLETMFRVAATVDDVEAVLRG
jgi:anti-sigma B factor antagonist